MANRIRAGSAGRLLAGAACWALALTAGAAWAAVDRRRHLALRHQADAIGRDDPETRLWIFRMEMEVVEQLKRIYGHARRIARTVLPPELASRAG
jgi:hypothetical protein